MFFSFGFQGLPIDVFGENLDVKILIDFLARKYQIQNMEKWVKNPKRGQHSSPEVAYLCPTGLPILRILWSRPTKSEIPSSRTFWKKNIPANCPQILPFQSRNLILVPFVLSSLILPSQTPLDTIEAIVTSKPVSWFMGRRGNWSIRKADFAGKPVNLFTKIWN